MASFKKFMRLSLREKLNFLLIVISILANRLLYLIFRFDKWHISPFINRKYAQKIVEYLNKNKFRNSAAEIGCGLGSIIRRIKYKKRDGLDSEVQVLKAARFISFITANLITYKRFEFPISNLDDRYDVIIMVNWIHHIEPTVLKSAIFKILINNINLKGRIILDTVQNSKYQYQHDIRFLTQGISCTVEKICEDKSHREVFAVIKSE